MVFGKTFCACAAINMLAHGCKVIDELLLKLVDVSSLLADFPTCLCLFSFRGLWHYTSNNTRLVLQPGGGTYAYYSEPLPSINATVSTDACRVSVSGSKCYVCSMLIAYLCEHKHAHTTLVGIVHPFLGNSQSST